MDLYILNLSDQKAKISEKEKIEWLRYLEWKWVSPIFFEDSLSKIEKNLNIFNTLALNNKNNSILVTSWWYESINYYNSLNATVTWSLNFIWFSDLLHLMYRYHDYSNVLCIYGLTLRNISELSEIEWKKLIWLIESQKFEEKLEIVSHKSNWDWLVYGWFILIFLNMILFQKIEVKDVYLYLEFHWLDERFAIYYIDFLNIVWLFRSNKWVILNFTWYAFEKSVLTEHILQFTNNVYISHSKFIPLFHKVTITKWNLILL